MLIRGSGSIRSAILRTKRKRNILFKLTAGIVALAVLSVMFLYRQPSPVGHWRSAEGLDAFMGHYVAAMTAMPQPDRVLDVRTQYGVVRAYRFAGGDGTIPLLLLPGRFSASPVWADNLPALLQIADVYVIDLLGEPGMSVQARPIRNDADHAAWLEQTLAGLAESRFHVVGLSIGGWTAANLALHAPGHVASVTLIDPVFVFDDMPLGTIMRSIPASLPFLPRAWRESFNSWTAGGAEVEHVPVAEMIEAGMQHYALRLSAPGRISEPALAGLDVPMLAIIAGQSVMHDSQAAVRVAESVASTVAVYDLATHAINGEYPEELANDISAFVGR